MIEILEYKPDWAHTFRHIRNRVWPHICHVAVAFEHVGSTSVPDLPAKPIIDIDVVIPSRVDLTEILGRLQAIGYEHRGELGIADRDAFKQPRGTPPHHLYVCPSTSVALRNHVTLRDHLRRHKADREAYATLKRTLAAACNGIDDYSRQKTDFILSILATYGFTPEELALIRRANE
jgi:GrpB-like predicted nucleotidyltransferase (UPF0157 family)